MDKTQLVKEAEAYVDASQRVKAVKEVLQAKRDELIPAFKKFVKADEKGNRTLEFGEAKISLVPQRKIDEEALKAVLGPDAARFQEHGIGISLHLIQISHGKETARQVEEAVKVAVRETLGVDRLPPKVAQVVHYFDADAALASLPKEDRRDVKEITTFTLRPYPEKRGFTEKVKAAWAYLSRSK